MTILEALKRSRMTGQTFMRVKGGGGFVSWSWSPDFVYKFRTEDLIADDWEAVRLNTPVTWSAAGSAGAAQSRARPLCDDAGDTAAVDHLPQIMRVLREVLDKWQALAEGMRSTKFQPPSVQKLQRDLERIALLRQLLPDQPTMNFAAEEGVLKHTPYCRACHARVQERADHTNDCSNCLGTFDCSGTFDHVAPRMFDPVSVEAGSTSEQCPWSASGKTKHDGVYSAVTWSKD
jgi:hypothetical protein